MKLVQTFIQNKILLNTLQKKKHKPSLNIWILNFICQKSTVCLCILFYINLYIYMLCPTECSQGINKADYECLLNGTPQYRNKTLCFPTLESHLKSSTGVIRSCSSCSLFNDRAQEYLNNGRICTYSNAHSTPDTPLPSITAVRGQGHLFTTLGKIWIAHYPQV